MEFIAKMEENDIERVGRILLEVHYEVQRKRAYFLSLYFSRIMLGFTTCMASLLLIDLGYLWVLKYIGAGLFAILLFSLYVNHKRRKSESKKTAYWP